MIDCHVCPPSLLSASVVEPPAYNLFSFFGSTAITDAHSAKSTLAISAACSVQVFPPSVVVNIFDPLSPSLVTRNFEPFLLFLPVSNLIHPACNPEGNWLTLLSFSNASTAVDVIPPVEDRYTPSFHTPIYIKSGLSCAITTSVMWPSNSE